MITPFSRVTLPLAKERDVPVNALVVFFTEPVFGADVPIAVTFAALVSFLRTLISTGRPYSITTVSSTAFIISDHTA